MDGVRFVDFKVFTEGHRTAVKERFHAPAGTKWTDEGVESLSRQFVSAITSAHPLKRFRAIRVSPTQVNVVHEVGEA